MTTSISGVLKELCSAPLEAAVQAEADYRTIWLKWIEGEIAMINTLDDATKQDIDWMKILGSAPAISVNSKVDLAITMRIASVKEVTAKGEVGLAVGPIHASGGVGFMSRSTTESTLQASTSVVLSNNEQNLLDYLGKHNITPTDPTQLDKAVALLKAE